MSDISRRRCNGTNRAGEPCGLAPIAGGFVCALHGGKAPQVRAKAQARLLALVEPVLDVFTEIVEAWNEVRCDKCGRPSGDPAPVIRVGQLVLDRAGFGPSAHLTISNETADETEPYLDWLTDDEIRGFFEMCETAQRRMEDGEPPPPRTGAALALVPSPTSAADIIDAVCVEEPEPRDGRVIGGNDEKTPIDTGPI